MPTKRFKLRNSKGEIRDEIAWSNYDELGEWIDEHIPPIPKLQRCENTEAHKGEILLPWAKTYSWRIEEGNVCYSYLCYQCGERLDDSPPDPEDYPTTKSGYAVSPKHCVK